MVTKLRVLALRREISLAELARRLGVSRGNISLAANGRFRFGEKRRREIARNLGVTERELFGADGFALPDEG